MNGLEIRQIYHPNHGNSFAIIKTAELPLYKGGFSRVNGLPNDAMWTRTVLTYSLPFKLILK